MGCCPGDPVDCGSSSPETYVLTDLQKPHKTVSLTVYQTLPPPDCRVAGRMDQSQHQHREFMLWAIHLHTNPASATLLTPHTCVRSMSMHCQSKPPTYTKLVVNLVCAFVRFPICDLALCLLSSLLPPFSFPLYFLMLFTTSLAIVQHCNLSVSLLINPNDVSCPGFLSIQLNLCLGK